MLIICALTGLNSCVNTSPLSPEDGLKAIKVLNSDLVNLSDGINGNVAFAGMKYLLEEPSSPLSSKNGLFGQWLNDTLSRMEPFSGKYAWNDNAFARVGTSDNIEIICQIPGSLPDNDLFTLSSFKCTKIASSLCFPQDIQAELHADGEEVMKFQAKTSFMDEIPEEVDCRINGKDYDFTLHALRTRENDHGTVAIELSFRAKGFEVLKGTILAQVGYSGNQMFYRTYEPDIDIFDVNIKGKMDYGKVDPTSRNYVKSFNDHCDIGFYDGKGGRKIGNFGIAELRGGELLGWALFLSDGSAILLEEHLLLVEKLLNYKLPNRIAT